MGAAGKIEILVGAQTEVAQAKLQDFASKAESAFQKFVDGLRIGLGIDVAQKLIAQIQRIPEAMEQAVQSGLAFNETLENARIGIAAVLRQFNPEKFTTFNAALSAAGSAIESLKQKALESPATFSQLVAAFQAVSGAATAARIPLQKQVDLVVLMSQTLAGMGIRSEQIIQESRALLTGNITEDAAAAKMLEIKASDIQQAKEAGRLYEFITDKMKGFAEAAKAGAQSMSTLRSNLADTFEQQMGGAAVSLFGTIKKGYAELTEAVARPEFQTALQNVFAILTRLVEVGFKIGNVLARNLEAASTAMIALGTAATVASGLGALQAAAMGFNAMMAAAFGAGAIAKAADLGAAISLLAGAPVAAVASLTAVLVALVAAIWAGVEAWKAYQAGQEEATTKGSLADQNDQLALFAQKLLQIKQITGEITQEKAAQLAMQLDETGQMLAPELRSDSLRAILKELRAAQEATRLPDVVVTAKRETPDNQKLLEDLNRQYKEALFSREKMAQDAYDERLRSLQFEVKDTEDFNLAKLQAEKIYQIELAKIRKEEVDKFDQAINEEMQFEEAARQKNLQRDMQAAGDGLRAQRDGIALERTKLDVDFRQPDFAKKSQRVALLEKEMAAIDGVIAKLKTLRDMEKDASARESITQQMTGFEGEKRGLQQDRARMAGAPDTSSFSDQFTAVTTDLRARWGTWASQMAHSFEIVFNSAISTISNGITGLIMGTQTWGEALRNIGISIVQSIIQAFVQMGVQWFMTHVLMEGISAAFAAGREALRAGETASEIGHVTARTAAHGAGEATKTGHTLFGAIGRGAIRLGETIAHGAQIAWRVATHIAGEIAMTAVTLVQAGIRIASTILEAGKYLIVAAIKAMNAVADIPFVGPILAVAALAGILAAGAWAMGAFADGGQVKGAGGRRSDSNLVRVSDGEYIIQANAVDKLGVPFLDAINDGRIPASESRIGGMAAAFIAGIGAVAREARGIDRGVAAGMTKPLTMDGEFMEAMAAKNAAESSGGGSTNVNVAPAPVNVAVLNDQGAYRQYLESVQGRKIILNSVRGAMVELGLNT